MAKSQQRIPMYVQIRDYILDQVKKKVWQPNDRLPSENELSAQFGVSRITIKNALAELIEDGLIYRVQGKGSFVSPEPAGEPLIYRPEPANQDSQLVALLMPRLDNKHTMHLLNGIESELTSHGYRIVFCKTYDSQEVEKQTLREVIRLGVKGIIIFPVDGESYSEEILRLTMNHFPLVVIDRYFRGIETNCVCSDNITGAHEATAHLISLGHTKIGFISTVYQGTTSIEDRLTGYEKALAEANIPVEHRLRMTHFTAENMNAILNNETANEPCKKDIAEFIRTNPDMTAIFAINSAAGLTVIETAIDMGVRIPEQLSLVFFDNDLSPLSLIPPTCVSQEETTLGHEAAKLLLSVIENPRQERRKIVIPPKLVVRKSTAKCPVHT